MYVPDVAVQVPPLVCDAVATHFRAQAKGAPVGVCEGTAVEVLVQLLREGGAADGTPVVGLHHRVRWWMGMHKVLQHLQSSAALEDVHVGRLLPQTFNVVLASGARKDAPGVHPKVVPVEFVTSVEDTLALLTRPLFDSSVCLDVPLHI